MPESRASNALSPFRTEALQDAVFAIVMTLLVLELKVPDVATPAELRASLVALWPSFLTYVVSFVNLGIYWVSQHNQYHYIERTDRAMLWLNLLFLLFVSLVPFTTSVLGRHPDMQLAYVIYGADLIAIGLIGYWQWCYATIHHRLTSHSISPRLVAGVKRRILLAPLVSAVAILASFFSMSLSLVFYVLLGLYYVWPGRVDRFWRQPALPHDD